MNGQQKIHVLFLSTYPPRACGIATFTQDLVGELKKTGKIDCEIVAVNNGEYAYPSEVKFTLEQQNPNSYLEIAERINHSGADLLMIEHEYGIYGGKYGEYLLNLTELLEIPYVVTLHTVLPDPTKKQKEIIRQLSEGCKNLFTMSSSSIPLLKEIYGVDPNKIVMVHHGVPEIPVDNRDTLKKEAGFGGRYVVSTFGLLSPGKGLEYGIEAIARTAEKHPEVLYLILGQTHPVIKSKDGEKYREKLEHTVESLGISKNVQFVNRYLTKEEIIRYLTLSDIYMTPYLGKDQAVSGTLAYAVGYGRVIVSTPYPYAQEMLADGRGLLAKFKSASSLTKCILEVLSHPDQQAEMERKTSELGKTMMWSRVAERYLSVFSPSASK
ncbi:MAG TPA: glycosyltransferase family 4 protein [Clostridia bacterium]|nr:glycosyltransferase family 4 protein [Clostridia bacterium]